MASVGVDVKNDPVGDLNGIQDQRGPQISDGAAPCQLGGNAALENVQQGAAQEQFGNVKRSAPDSGTAGSIVKIPGDHKEHGDSHGGDTVHQMAKLSGE